jgi:hypothetical protein
MDVSRYEAQTARSGYRMQGLQSEEWLKVLVRDEGRPDANLPHDDGAEENPPRDAMPR